MPGKKRGRGGKQQGPENARKKQKKANPDKVRLPQDQPEHDVVIDEDDLGFVNEFHSNLGFLESLNTKQLNRQAQKGITKGKAKAEVADSDSDDDGLEAEYERAPRQQLHDKEHKQKALLPTKSLHGELVYVKDKQDNKSMPKLQVPQGQGITVLEDQNDSDPDADSVADSDVDSSASELGTDASVQKADSPTTAPMQKAGKASKTATGISVQSQDDEQTELQQYENAQERREELKQQLAVTASKVLQNPEAHLPTLKSVLALAADQDAQVSKLAMLSLLAVFKDILPGYRIRLPTEKELDIPVSKEVKQTRDYEAMQLRFYQAYLKLLLNVLSSKGKAARSSSQIRVAARCMCGLLSALHHFNYSTDLLQAVVPLMVHQDGQLQAIACEAVEDVLIHDTEGKVAVAAVQLVADLIRRRKCQCPAQVVDTLLVLKLKEAAPQGASTKGKRGVKTKGKSKKSRRADEVEQAFKEAEATADRAEARVTQSQMLLALFEIFFRVLKQCTQSGVQSQSQGYKMTAVTAQKRLPLLLSSLHGLTKYAHLISVEYFADLLQVMQHIMQMSALPLQQRLCCLLTASNILKGQGEALNIDRREMYARLYACIPELAVLPLLPDNLGLRELSPSGTASEASSSQSENAVGQNQPAAVLLLSVAQQMLLEQSKSLDTARLAAFTKQFSCTALHLETGASLGSVALVNRLLRHNMKLRTLLEHEAGAPPPIWAASAGSTDGLSDSDTALAGAPLWELALLHRHYHPTLAKTAAAVAAIPPQGGGHQNSSGVLATAHEPDSLAASFSTCTGAFKPAPRPPVKTATPCKASQPLALTRETHKAEEHFVAQLRDSDDMYSQPQTDNGELGELQDVGNDSLSRLIQSWFKEQRHFSDNVQLRKQHSLLSWQLQKLRKHLGERQHQKMQHKGWPISHDSWPHVLHHMLVPLGYRRLHQSRRKQCTMHARNALFRAGFNTAQWCKARINGEATKAGEGRGSFNTKRLTIYSGAALVAVSSVAAVSAHQRTFKQDLHSSHLLDSPWVQAIPQQQDVLQVLSAESISTHPLLSHDHLFTTMLQTGQLSDMVCFYDTEAHKYYTVLQLGKGVCGFPTIVHGGLTATVMDETLGFLLFALKKQKALPFWGPAYTAHLEVNYKSKISSGATILCTAEVESVEGRKLWMKSTVTDGPTGKVYATARALFVAPSMNRLANDAVKLVKDGVFPPKRMGSSM